MRSHSERRRQQAQRQRFADRAELLQGARAQSGPSPQPNAPVQQQQQQQQQTDVNRLQDTLRMSVETEDIGAETLDKLRKQREQLQRASDDIGEVDATLTKSAWVLRSMNSWTGRLSNWLKGSPDAGPVERRNAQRRASEQAATGSLGDEEPVQRSMSFNRSTPLESGSTMTRSIRTDTEVSALAQSVRNLGLMANEMGNELQLHNRLLDGLDEDMDTVQTRLKSQNRQLKRMV